MNSESDTSPASPLATVLKISDLLRIREWQGQVRWQPFSMGVEIYRLYGDGVSGPTAALLRFSPGGRVALHEHMGYEHILVLEGSQVDESNRASAGSLIIHPPGTSHSILSETGCIVLAIYEKPVRFLDGRSGQAPHGEVAPHAPT